MSKINVIGLLMLLPAYMASAGDEPAGPHNGSAWQIWAYSSAAPAFLSKNATIIGGDGSVLRKGSNGWTCQAGNPRPFPASGWKTAHKAMPACFDEAGAAWMSAYMMGKKPQLERDGYMWMLHGDVGEDNFVAGVLNKDDANPEHWIESGPHFMIMPKEVSSIANVTTDFNTGGPYVMLKGTGYDHIMLPVTGYYQYQPQKQ